MFQTTNDEYHVEVAYDLKEACQLVEIGFGYVTGEYYDGGKSFRKQKLLYLGSQTSRLFSFRVVARNKMFS
jgi:hypothetical protein